MLAKAKEMLERARQVAVGLSDLEIKVENATNNDPWGPHGSLMSDISSAAFDADGYKEIVGVLAQRLHGEPKNWRQVYKSLLLLEYMLKNGPMRIVNELQSSARLLERLQRFEYRDEKGKDQGLNVRNRAKLLLELANDPERVKQEREKAAKNRNKYGGVSSDQSMSFGGSGSRGFRGDGYGATDTSGGGGLSSYSRDSNGAGSRSNDGGQAEEELEDAVEATKNRIQQLDLAADTAGGSGAESAAAATPGKKTPKRLSEVKVSPMIAAGLGKAGPPPAAAPAAAVAVAAAPPPAADLLGGLHDAPATPAAPAAAPASDLLGGLEAASPAPEPEAEQWDAFQDAQAAPAAAAGAAASADPFSTLAGSEAQPQPSGFDALVAPTPAAASGVDALHVAAAAPPAAKPAGAATPVALDESLFAAPAAPTPYAAANGAAGMAAPGMPPMMGAPGGFGASQAMPHPAAAAAFPHRPAMPFPGGGYAMPQAGASGMMPAAVPGAMPGPMPGAMPGAMHGAMPRVMPGTMPGAVPGVMPGTMPGSMPGVMPGAMPAHMRSAGGAPGGAAAVKLGAPGRARSGQKDPFADLNVL